MLGTGVPGAALSWPEPLCKTEQGEDAAVQGSRERRIGALGRQEGSQHRHQRQLHSQGLPEEPSQQEPLLRHFGSLLFREGMASRESS